MSDAIHWVLEVAVKPGQGENFKALVQDMAKATQANEPGVLIYEWNLAADGTTCQIYERYKDSAAILTHLENFGKNFAGRFFDVVAPTKFYVYGTPNEEAKKGLAVLGPVYFKQVGGFRR
jgi:quinol monooxygenase YgiN